MSADAISPLRQRMIEDMSARKLSLHTQRSHISSCKRFAAYLKRSPKKPRPMISACSNYTWLNLGQASAIATVS